MSALNVRLLASRLAETAVRDALGHYLLIAFVLIAWTVLVFIPLRIVVEALRPFGTRMRRTVAEGVVGDPRRFERPELLSIVVGDLFVREVTMPRFTKPEHALKTREAAVAILARTATGTDVRTRLHVTIRATLAAAATEAVAVSAAATGIAADNIQARWEGARALGGLAALTTILVAAYRDRWGAPPDLPELEGRPVRGYLEAAFDYCDEAALEVEALPWTEPPLGSSLPAESTDDVRAAWKNFLAAGTPAPRALETLLAALLPRAGG